MNADGCTWVDEVAAELALGLLSGAERAEALAHMERCGRCQDEVSSLTGVAEQLLLLAPEIPPPAGFESRVLARIDPVPEALRPSGSSGTGRSGVTRTRNGRRRPPWRSVLGAVAAVLVVLVGAAGVWVAFADDDNHSQVAVTVADLRSNHNGDVVGQATVRHSSPPVVELEMKEWIDALKAQGEWPVGDWLIEVQDGAGGSAHYPVRLAESPAKVTLVEPQPGSDRLDMTNLTTVAVRDGTGHTWCTAKLNA
ncbi:MAG TPA: hypothetical protein VGJ86_10630 [Acidimicrobiales bacterium]|jgi:hypothetical protein